MSKKKSYMSHKNVLLENKFIDILKNLFSITKSKKQSLSQKEKQALKNPLVRKYLQDFAKAHKQAQAHAKKVKQNLDKKGFIRF
mgnify:CR=1 FL=1